jgi:hypothetical protein
MLIHLKYIEDAVQRAVLAQLENTPHRLLNTYTGRLCDRDAQINDFKASTEYKKLLVSTIKHADFGMKPIRDVVEMYFRCVMLSHRWEGKESLLRHIQDNIVILHNRSQQLLTIRGSAGRGLIPAASTRLTTSRSKSRSIPCLPGIVTQHSQLCTCRMCRLRQRLAHWQRVFGSHEDGLFKNSWLLDSFSSTKKIGPCISMTALPITRSRLRSCRS